MPKRHPRERGTLKVRVVGTFEIPVWVIPVAIVVAIILLVVIFGDADKVDALVRLIMAIGASLIPLAMH